MAFSDVKEHNQVQSAPLVVLVDDNPENLKLLATLLPEHGFVVKASSSEKFALQSVCLELPSLIILDIMTPEIVDGFEVCRRL